MAIKYYSVTEVLSPWSNEKFQQQGITEKKLMVAAAKGTLCHSWCEAYLLDLPLPTVPEIYQGYTKSFALWADKFVRRVLWTEKELTDEQLFYKGHPDFLAYCDFSKGEVLALPDLKTPIQYSVFWEAQLGGYLNLVRKEGWFPDWVGSLQLQQDGGWPKPKKLENPEIGLAKFLVALQARRIFG